MVLHRVIVAIGENTHLHTLPNDVT